MNNIPAFYHPQSIGAIVTRLNEPQRISLRPTCLVEHRVKTLDRLAKQKGSRRANLEGTKTTARLEAVGFGLALAFVCVLAGSFAWGITIFCKLIDRAIPILMQNPSVFRLG